MQVAVLMGFVLAIFIYLSQYRTQAVTPLNTYCSTYIGYFLTTFRRSDTLPLPHCFGPGAPEQSVRNQPPDEIG